MEGQTTTSRDLVSQELRASTAELMKIGDITCPADSWKATTSAIAASDGSFAGGTGVEPSASTSPAEFHLFVSVSWLGRGAKAACFKSSLSLVSAPPG